MAAKRSSIPTSTSSLSSSLSSTRVASRPKASSRPTSGGATERVLAAELRSIRAAVRSEVAASLPLSPQPSLPSSSTTPTANNGNGMARDIKSNGKVAAASSVPASASRHYNDDNDDIDDKEEVPLDDAARAARHAAALAFFADDKDETDANDSKHDNDNNNDDIDEEEGDDITDDAPDPGTAIGIPVHIDNNDNNDDNEEGDDDNDGDDDINEGAIAAQRELDGEEELRRRLADIDDITMASMPAPHVHWPSTINISAPSKSSSSVASSANGSDELMATGNARINPFERKLQSRTPATSSDGIDDDSLRAEVEAAVRSRALSSITDEQKQIDRDIDDALNRPSSITMSMIAERCLPAPLLQSGDSDAIGQAAFNLRQLVLDGMNISQIDSLECFNQVTHLYLQRNHIKRIEGLEFMPQLQFLALFDNQITVIEGLSHLKQLRFLDLAHNDIADIPAGSIPVSLLALRLHHNPCAAKSGYITSITNMLPSLSLLDDQQLAGRAAISRPVSAVPSPAVAVAADDTKQAADDDDPLRWVCDSCGKLLLLPDHYHCYDCVSPPGIDLCSLCFTAKWQRGTHVASHRVLRFTPPAVAPAGDGYNHDDNDDLINGHEQDSVLLRRLELLRSQVRSSRPDEAEAATRASVESLGALRDAIMARSLSRRRMMAEQQSATRRQFQRL